MPTLDDLSRDIDDRIREVTRVREGLTTEVKAILDVAKNESRTHLTTFEQGSADVALHKRGRIDTELEELRSRRADLDKVITQEMETDKMLSRSDPHATNVAERRSYDQVARIGRSERTYRPDGPGGRGGDFLADVARSVLNHDSGAQQRLASHMSEERVERGQHLERAVGSGGFAGLTVPQYLVDLYAPAVSNLSPLVDVCTKHPLPPAGMTVNISRITTPAAVALQATENTTVANQDMDDTLLTENVQTIAGQQTVSRQAIDRGLGVEDVVVNDLLRRHAAGLDNTLINQSVTGVAALATATSYTDASPTGPELYPKILGAAAGVETSLLGMGVPNIAVMHSRRWTWLQSQMTNQWPMFGQPGIPAQNTGVNNATPYGSGYRGLLPNGLAVVVDNNIATNLGGGTEDEIYIASTDELHLWTDPNAPIFIRADQPAANSLGVLLVVYSYFAFSARRFTGAVGKVSGSGLAAPTF